ncbi:hypothetical protein ADN01_01945 [Levilinea saccharolytica]|uniref:Uncharacterized protein n=1 Tax=Levilinea saccharolytica TaxID=229921 RepID=A0A0P6YF99_9CHLR|nr:hypothetical protein ADN01_01945 [Levilinea saccharolytica]
MYGDNFSNTFIFNFNLIGEISGNFYSQLHSFFILCNHCFSSGKLAIGIGNSYSSFKSRVDSLFHISSSVIWNNLYKHIVVNVFESFYG